MVLYREKNVSEFQRVLSITEALSLDHDTIFIDIAAPSCGINSSYLMDAGTAPYVISLHRPKLVPSCSLNPLAENSLKDKSRQSRLQYKTSNKQVNLVSTSDGSVFPESFCGYGAQGIASHRFAFDGNNWVASHDQEFIEHKGLYLFTGILSAHFGHFLVDSLSHLWPLLLYGNDIMHLIDGFVAFAGHRLPGSSALWPSFIPETLSCLSIPRSRIIIVDRPMSFQKCLVPRKISPFNCGGGKLYNETMQAISAKIQLETPNTLYLSRSLLDKGARKDEGNIESKIEAIFRDRGFTIVHPQLLPLSEQARIISRATRIAGCVGSQLHLIAFSKMSKLQVFRIGPESFLPTIDASICAGISEMAKVTDYKVSYQAPKGPPRHSVPFLDYLDLADLALRIDEWLQLPY